MHSQWRGRKKRSKISKDKTGIMTQEKAKAERYSESVSTDFVKFGVKPSDGSEDETVFVKELNGTLDGIETKRNSEGREVGKYKLTDDDGKIWAFNGTVVLDDLLGMCELGDDVFITYTHSDPPAVKGHSPTKQFTVDRAPRPGD